MQDFRLNTCSLSNFYLLVEKNHHPREYSVPLNKKEVTGQRKESKSGEIFGEDIYLCGRQESRKDKMPQISLTQFC